jgi:hypothetical protein
MRCIFSIGLNKYLLTTHEKEMFANADGRAGYISKIKQCSLAHIKFAFGHSIELIILPERIQSLIRQNKQAWANIGFIFAIIHGNEM